MDTTDNMFSQIADAVKGIFFRFGSTRLLALGMYLWFLSGSPETTEAYLGGAAFVLTVVLMMFRPHTAHKEIEPVVNNSIKP